MTYQSHEGECATSDSGAKLRRIRLPNDLTGKRVLDLGCNEGFFCGEAARRGAKYVLGIDIVDSALELAKEKYGSATVEFQRRRWTDMPSGPFDVVLWLSSMHYERDPAPVFRQIREALAPNGVFILECGVREGQYKEITPVPRTLDQPWYPTSPLLWQWLGDDFTVRMVAPPEFTPGDAIPRSAYHCHPLVTTVLLFRGRPMSGKSTATRQFAGAATKTISVDSILALLSRKSERMGELQKWLNSHFDRTDIWSAYRGIDESGLTTAFAEVLAGTISTSDRTVIIDGAMSDQQAVALQECLGSSFAVWDATRVATAGSADS